MKLQVRKRKQPNLRKLTKTDALGAPVSSEPLYVLLDEAEDNVETEGTAITPDVIDKVNWKDEACIEFTLLEGNDLPLQREGVVQIVAKQNGELWCIPPNQEAYPLGSLDLQNYMLKSGKVYVSGKSLEYFNINKEVKIFSIRTRIGAIPVRLENSTQFDDGTYIEFDKSGYCKLFTLGTPAFVLTNERMEIKINESSIRFDRTGNIHLNAPTKSSDVSLSGKAVIIRSSKLSIQSDDIDLTGKICISNDNIKIQETSDGKKFNCFTNLEEASYGNKNFRLQFYPDCIRLQDVNNNKKIFQINQDGTIRINDTAIPTTHPLGFNQRYTTAPWGAIASIGNCVTAWDTANGGAIQFREQNTQLYVGIDGFFYQNEGNYKVIDENSIESYIQAYLDKNFENYFLNFYKKYYDYLVLFMGCQQEVYQNVEEFNNHYRIDFSTTPNSEIMTIEFIGTNIGYMSDITDAEGNRYEVRQYEASDGQTEDYIFVVKLNADGTTAGRMYIRRLLCERK